MRSKRPPARGTPLLGSAAIAATLALNCAPAHGPSEPATGAKGGQSALPPRAPSAVESVRARMRLPADRAGVHLRMQGVSYQSEQAARPEEAAANVPAKQTLVLARDGRFRLQTDTLYPGEIRFRFLTVGSATGSATIDELQWRNGVEINRDGAEGARGDLADLLLFAPALLFDEALVNDLAAEAPAVPSQGGEGAAEVRATFTDPAGRRASLTIDARAGVVTSATSGGRRYVYEAYGERGGLRQPARVSVFEGERAVARWSIEGEPLAAPADEGAFALPEGYVEKASRGELRATQLGPGVYRVDGAPSGYHTGFVVGARSVAVFDAPIGAEEAGRVRGLIERTAPGRAIAYVIVSHAHRDHVAGLPAYVAAGAQIVVGAGGAVALRRQLGEAAIVRPIELGAPRDFDLGGRKVNVYPLDSAHAADMLVGYDSQSHTIFQGDLFYLPEVGPTPPAFVVTEGLAKLIAERRLDVRRVVGVHGRTGDARDLAESLRLRSR